MDVSSGQMSSGIQASLAGRYATALFDIARDAKSIELVETSLGKLRAALDESAELQRLTTSPLVSRAETTKTVDAIATALDLDPTTRNFLGVLSENRRLGQLGAVIKTFRLLAAHHRGETTAEVTSAHPLGDDQVDALRQALRQRLGREVAVDLSVDPSLLGGLVVRIGSQMIDSSIKTRLNALAHAMKG